ncbi:FKBP-type peptidyl-prolyl cis-trans isomerase [Handroanthus impetiginosus]|uniref:peptidylprolyl isomerase n=1 Tax=Handroanthus impetiginosus TaxID=429701 RepID=A0A2G9HU87_9LAMI|nr:FKBP-type peptidyl-prolyl cis-trans isomerase [Handroanthus impetiginosus]
MAFWGVEVKPGKPYIHRSDDERGRLHLSQATLGTGSSTKKSIVQCKVGDKKPIYLCSLLPEKLENCALNLEFEEDDEVTFSIIGSHSVHLSGFFYGDNEDQDNFGDDYGSDPYEMGTDSEDEDDSIDYDSEDEDDDLGLYPSSPVPNSGVRIEEIVEDEKSPNENGMPKRAKKKKTQSSMSDDNENSNRQIVVNGGNDVSIFESEDEDGFPISAHEKKSDSKSETKSEETNNERISEKTLKEIEKADVAHGKNLKRKIDTVGQDGEPARENIHGSSVQPDNTIPENEVKQKKSKKKKVTEKVEIAQENGLPNSNGTEESPVADIGTDLKASSETKKEKKKKKKNKQQEIAITPNAEENLTGKKGPILDEQGKKEAKSLQIRSFPNGLVIEELVMGKPDGKKASPGKKVSVHYIGKLKKNGKIFDSNIGRAPFKFRLGIGQVIKGWDVGVNGMRIGDKRRLTIPPAMGYGAKGCPPAIPPNSWLVFDVELVDVN